MISRLHGRRGWLGLGAVALAVLLAGIGVAALGGRLAPASAAGPVPAFVDETAASGLGFTYDGPFAYAVGGGLAVFDCDDDGMPDIFLAGGAGPAALFRNVGALGGELRFERSASSGTELAAVNGAYPLDIDGDGITDLVTLRNGENVAFRGLGGCRFERANEAWGLDGGAELTEAFSATWEAGQT
ncbi:MAG: VCBS repeat-containing protein, partial [Chloroflexota bacterium]